MTGRARPFADFLREQRRGELLNDLTDALHEAAGASVLYGKPSTLNPA